MPPSSLVIPLVLSLTVAPPPAAASTQCLEQALPVIREAATREDSLALADRFEREPPDGSRACADLLAGYLIGMTSTPAEDAWRERQKGIELLESALRNYSGEPRLYLAMGILLHHRQSRTDGLRTLDRALDRLGGSTVPLTDRERALIHYVRGVVHQDLWRDWRSFGVLDATAQGQWHCGDFEDNVRDNFTSSSTDNRWLIGFDYTCPDVFARNMAQFFNPRASLHREHRERLDSAFRRALAIDPTMLAAPEALLAEYAYEESWDLAQALVDSLRARFPEDGRTLLWRGLILHATGRDSLAGPEFARAFALLPPEEADRLADIGLLLTPAQQEWFASVDSTTRRQAAAAFWNSLDPLYLTTVNERRIEHYARVVAADLIFAAPTLRLRGAETLAGQMWIRYGRPLNIWELAIPGGRAVFWDYGPGPELTFTRGMGYQSYRRTDQGQQYTEGLQQTTPQTYDARAVYDSLVPLDHQVVRTLDHEARPQILVYAGIPDGFGTDARAAFLLMDPQYQPAAQWRGARPEGPGLRAELNQVQPGSYSLTVEVWDAHQRMAGRVRDTVTTLAVEDSAFTVSDLLLAGPIRAQPGVDDPQTRRDLELQPVYGRQIGTTDPLGLYWEMYRFSDPDGRVRTRVTLEVEDAGGRSIFARVLGGVGIGGEREPETRIRYESTRPLLNGRAVEWIELAPLPAGEYRVRLRLEDRDSGRTVTRERSLVVS